MRDFASKHSCMLVEGSISHQHILEYLAAPGMMILGADSHTCQAGCVGAFALELEVQKLQQYGLQVSYG
jgi:homoaconitase/3-isopropylmalate dehydratase large subunit